MLYLPYANRNNPYLFGKVKKDYYVTLYPEKPEPIYHGFKRSFQIINNNILDDVVKF